MSLDTHKYGYALKGTSVVLYRNRALRQSQYFCYADWTGGMYTTPTIAGSRSGGLIAQCKESLSDSCWFCLFCVAWFMLLLCVVATCLGSSDRPPPSTHTLLFFLSSIINVQAGLL